MDILISSLDTCIFLYLVVNLIKYLKKTIELYKEELRLKEYELNSKTCEGCCKNG